MLLAVLPVVLLAAGCCTSSALLLQLLLLLPLLLLLLLCWFRGESECFQEIDDAEAFMDGLADVSCVAGALWPRGPVVIGAGLRSYDVVKTNERGRRQRRTLKLTTDSVLNLRGGVVTKAHSYMDVTHVSLVTHETMRICYCNDHAFVYSSPIALQVGGAYGGRRVVLRELSVPRSLCPPPPPHTHTHTHKRTHDYRQIVQELSNRLEVLHAVNKKKVSFDVARQFQVCAAAVAVAHSVCPQVACCVVLTSASGAAHETAPACGGRSRRSYCGCA